MSYLSEFMPKACLIVRFLEMIKSLVYLKIFSFTSSSSWSSSTWEFVVLFKSAVFELAVFIGILRIASERANWRSSISIKFCW